VDQPVLRYIDLTQLCFDPDNPRLPVDLLGVCDDQRVITHMLRDESLIELMGSIAETGYSPSEPLLVAPKKDGSYCVVEGNRRLAALKLLEHPELATVRVKSVNEIASKKKGSNTKIPVIVYNDREDILDYLGYRHITGVKSWGALEKARYLRQLYIRHAADSTSNDEICRSLAKMIGSRADYVGKLLAGLNLLEYANELAYFGMDLDDGKINFSLLTTAISYENIYRYIGLNSATDQEGEGLIEENVRFLFERLFHPDLRIAESRELSQLSAIVGNSDALMSYKQGASLEEAAYFTDAPIEAFYKFLRDASTSLEKAARSVEKLNIGNCDTREGQELLRILHNRIKSIEGMLKDSEDE